MINILISYSSLRGLFLSLALKKHTGKCYKCKQGHSLPAWNMRIQTVLVLITFSEGSVCLSTNAVPSDQGQDGWMVQPNMKYTHLQEIQNDTEICVLEKILTHNSTNPSTAFLRLLFFTLKSMNWTENQGEMRHFLKCGHYPFLWQIH